jgi:uracil-DNA glycosylase
MTYSLEGCRSIQLSYRAEKRAAKIIFFSLQANGMLKNMDVKIDPTWKAALKDVFSQPYFAEIVRFIKTEKAAGKTVYPPGSQIFHAFDATPFDRIRVVILGQDPYHGPGQAQGLCFSVPEGIKPPPSLVNIYKELREDVGMPIPQSGNLQKWAVQGVLLLNAALTVRAAEPNSHAAIWAPFTDAVIQQISAQKKGIVFLLWGKFAQDKQVLIDAGRHHILKAAHPSPFSANNGFFGCRHFSKTNALLTGQGQQAIDWSLA